MGVSDYEGNQILPIRYDRITVTDQGNFLVNQQGLLGLADRNGTLLQNVNAKRITGNRLETFPVWTVRDATNKIIDKIYADSIRLLESDRWLLFRNQKQTIYQPNSELSSSFQDAVIVSAREDAVLVKSERGMEVFRPDGRRLLKEAYDSIYFDKNYYYALKASKQGDRWYLFTSQGTSLTPKPMDGLLPASAGRIRFEQQGFWGILDFDGNILVQPKYDTILPFIDKKAIVSQLGKWGVIDNQNQWVILPYEEELQRLDNSLYASKKGYHIKFFSKEGDYIRSITTRYELLGDDVKIYGETGKSGLMNTDGRMITSIAYDQIDSIAGSNLFFAKIDSTGGIIDRYERTIISFSTALEEVVGISENRIGVKLEGKYGFVNSNGQLIIANRYDDIQLFSEGLAAYQLNGKWGFLNEQEQLVVQPYYDEVLPFNQNVAAVRDGTQWGLIDQNGNIIEKIKYSKLLRTKEGKYEIYGDKGAGLLDAKEQQILIPSYEVLEDIGNRRAIIRKNKKWGVVNYDGTYFIPTLYQRVLYSPQQDLFLIRENE